MNTFDAAAAHHGFKALRVALALAALAQIIWIIADYGAERRETMERLAVGDSSTLGVILHREVETAAHHLSLVQAQAENVLRSRIRDRVDEAVEVAEAIYRNTKGKLRDSEIADLIRETLREPRFFEGRGYYFAVRMDGICILLPTIPEYEGTQLLDRRDGSGRYITKELFRAVDNAEGMGYTRYTWRPPGNTGTMEDKVAFVRLFKPLNWMIATGDYLSQVSEKLKLDALDRLRSVRLTHGGRLVVLDETATVRLFRDDLNIEGKPASEAPDGPERAALDQIIQAAGDGGGVKIMLPDPATGRLRSWSVWAQKEDTFGWIVAAMAPDSDVPNDRGDHAGAMWWVGRYLIPALLMAFAGLGVVLLPMSSPKRKRPHG